MGDASENIHYNWTFVALSHFNKCSLSPYLTVCVVKCYINICMSMNMCSDHTMWN